MSLFEAQCQVRDFMMAAGQTGPLRPTVPDIKTMQLRYNLIHEELQEYCNAVTRNEMMGHIYSEQQVLAEVADAVADLLYVVIGTAVAFGIEIAPVFEAVHESNMAKFGPGGHRRADGKWMKPADWRAPDLQAILAVQMD